jgi:hypothetical protein
VPKLEASIAQGVVIVRNRGAVRFAGPLTLELATETGARRIAVIVSGAETSIDAPGVSAVSIDPDHRLLLIR